jgi:hypothetical protein
VIAATPCSNAALAKGDAQRASCTGWLYESLPAATVMNGSGAVAARASSVARTMNPSVLARARASALVRVFTGCGSFAQL